MSRAALSYYCPQKKFAKVMFLQVSVHRGGMCGRWGVRGCRGPAWLPGGAYMVARRSAWLWGACMIARGCTWLPGGMHGCQGAYRLPGACVVGGVHGWGHAWLGVCAWLGGMHGCRGVCMVTRGHACPGVCVVVGGGRA